MNHLLFDASLLPLRQARADRLRGDYFLHERAFEDCLDRIATVKRAFDKVLLLGAARKGWAERLRLTGARDVAVADGSADPLPLFQPDLCVSIGLMDTADELPALLTALRHMIAPEGLLIGAFAGGQSLPALRSAMAAADREDNAARAHIHPMIDPASFAGLMASAGFVDTVVDVDRVDLRYRDLDTLVRDLRAMAATNRLIERPRNTVTKAGLVAASNQFNSAAVEGRTSERIDIIHFSGWAPADQAGNSELRAH